MTVKSKDCYILFIDESGNGSRRNDKTNLWVTAGVISNIADHANLSKDLLELRKQSMRLFNKEFKGTDLSSNHLNPGITKKDVAYKLGCLIEKYHLSVFVTASNMSPQLSKQTKFVASNSKKGLQAKDVARELLLERVSIMLNYAKINDRNVMIIWDLSDNNELMDFSTVVGAYVNPHDDRKLNSTIIPHVLGGLSHDWAELQIADLVSNFALNYLAREYHKDIDCEKSEAFGEQLYPKLHSRNGKIEGIGLKFIHFNN